jgi:PPM family protein phosphatase
MRLIAAGLSDTGRVRANNQDSWAVVGDGECPFGMDCLLVVADGMGGHRGGATASHLAVSTIARYFAVERQLGTGDDTLRLAAAAAAVSEANQAIYQESSADPRLAGMGTTCTLLLSVGFRLYIGHVGDSRAYLFRSGRAHQLTSDHSVVAEQVRRGLMTAEQAEHDERRHMLLRAVGARPEVEVDTFSVDPQLGDTLLLCSDGLTNMLGDEQLAALTDAAAEPAEACSRLIAAANARGGEDNITAIVARLVG